MRGRRIPRRTRSPTILCIQQIVRRPHRPLHLQTICLHLLSPLHLLSQLHTSPKRKDYAEHTRYRTLPLLHARITLLRHSLMSCLTVTRCMLRTKGSPRRRYCDESSRLRILIPFQDQHPHLPLSPLQGAYPSVAPHPQPLCVARPLPHVQPRPVRAPKDPHLHRRARQEGS